MTKCPSLLRAGIDGENRGAMPYRLYLCVTFCKSFALLGAFEVRTLLS